MTAPERLRKAVEGTPLAPSFEVRADDVIFPHDERWIAERYDVEKRWDGETEGLEFGVYARRA